MPDPRTFMFDLPKRHRPSYAKINEEWYPGIQEYWRKISSSRICDPILGIKAVVIHATSGISSSGALGVLCTGRTSWHWLVPDGGEIAHENHVWACVPEARAARHVKNTHSHLAVNSGATKVNHWSLGIEIVNSQNEGVTEPFTDWQIETTAGIVRYCWSKYPNLSQIVSHALLDPKRRSDPGAHFPWDKLVQLVVSPCKLETVPESVQEAPPINRLSEAGKKIWGCGPQV